MWTPAWQLSGAPETGEAQAQQVLASGDRLTAPALIRVEVAAAIARKPRFHEIHEEDAEAAANLWLRAIADGVIALSPDEADIGLAVKLALQLQHPLQDCLYLALAAYRRDVDHCGPGLCWESLGLPRARSSSAELKMNNWLLR